MDAVGRVAKQIGARGFFASVGVSLTPAAERRATLSLAAKGNRWQEWSDAATAGVVLGLELADAFGDCVVTLVHGMDCDTSPGLVAVAGIRAAWVAVSFTPAPTLAEAIEDCIRHGHRLSPAAIRALLMGSTAPTELGAAPDPAA